MSGDPSLYKFERVAQELQRDIERGLWPVGARLPKADDQCGRFDVSRPTLFRAYDRLERLGMIANSTGMRPVVTSLRPQRVELDLAEIRETLHEILALLRKVID